MRRSSKPGLMSRQHLHWMRGGQVLTIPNSIVLSSAH
jgi:hypothetical protein